MTVKQLRAFLAVARTLSFTQACEQLHLSQPALSLAIKGLEDSLGGRLLIRTTRSVRLTPEGESLVPLAKRLLVEWDNTEDALRQRFTLQLGRLSLAAMPAFAGNLLAPSLAVFHRRHPRINVTVHDVVNEQVIDMVRQRQVEMGIAFEPEATGSLHFTPLFSDRFIAVLPPRSPLVQHSSLSWDTLMNWDFVALQRPSMVRRLLEQQLGSRHGALKVAFETHQLASVGRMVANGLGVSAVPALCMSQMQEAGAVCRPLSDPAIERRVGIVTWNPHELSVAARAMVDILESATPPPQLPSRAAQQEAQQ
ncbi:MULTISPECIES: LysR family transcriptional regulator [unclassified Halomonas]|uniref:LysR family transcriptional regulator n=1 Tax=unclassified Halomonas TaxID=2609666 RepID=UPI001C95BFF1|nr:MULTISPECIES: LysR family transcriptional regulator [unclassified Halomonas]MBY5925802.1 LysR family transcriptional regulator [Halomonas sp. DP4Y7-2]MBY6232844.1 LysR family transcriptional regulator [Halomonas sp. DP4Y7-1]